ncbi:uncharacterized protein LOC123321125 [Coccinella septempunctata]|uniref:uncharacterized protein LOC123321125 n=1 Tax=Coccinella septempunctata TaxID=41139 RepID=UPI001D07B279|nr:uncharacterized protein LOC123321125 [Coccinella septempunctata]
MREQAEKEIIPNNNCSLLHSTLTEAIIELLDEETLEILEKKLMHTINIRYGDAIERDLRNDEKFRHLFEDFPSAPFNDSKKSSADSKNIIVPSTIPPQCASPSDTVKQPVKKMQTNAKHSVKPSKPRNKINGYSNFKKLQPKVDKQKVIVQYSNNGVFVAPVVLNENNFFPSIRENRQTNSMKDKNDFFHSNQTKKKVTNIKPIKVLNQESIIDNGKMANVINKVPLRKIRTITRKPLANRSDYEISEDSAIPASRSSILPEVELIHKSQEFTSSSKKSPELVNKAKSEEIVESKASQGKENLVLLPMINPNVTISIINKPPLKASNNKRKIESADNQTKNITHETSDKVTLNVLGTEAKNISTENNDKVSWIKDASTKNITTYLRKNSRAKKSVIEEDIINRLSRMLLNGIEVKNAKTTSSSTYGEEKKVDSLQKKNTEINTKSESVSVEKDPQIMSKRETVSKDDEKQKRNAINIEKDFPISISLNKIIDEMGEEKHSSLNLMDVMDDGKREAQKTTDTQDINGKKNDENRESNASDDLIGSKEEKSISDMKINGSNGEENNIKKTVTIDKNDKLSIEEDLKTVVEKRETDEDISQTEKKKEKITHKLAKHKNDIEYVTIPSVNKENKIEIININTEPTEETANSEKFISVNYESSVTTNDAESIQSNDGSTKDHSQTFLVKIIYKKDDPNIEDFDAGYPKQTMDEEQNFDVEITKVPKEQEKESDEIKARKRTWEETKDKDSTTKRYNLRSLSSTEKVQKKRMRRLFGPTEIVTRSRVSL